MSTPPVEAFEGFGPDAVDFYVGLEMDNSKAYWERHRDVFREQVQQPMLALAAALGPQFGPFRMFRPHRDVRFSHDKSPYKTAHGALYGNPGGADHYLHFSASGLMVAAGIYQLERDQLRRWRDAVADPRTGPTLVRQVRAVQRHDLLTESGLEPPLKTAPRGYDRDHPRIEWLRWKGCIASTELEPALARTPAARDAVLETWQQAAPLVRWLERHVGPSQPDEPD